MQQAFPLFLEKVVFALFEDLDTPRSLTAKLLMQHGEWDQLLSLRADPAQYNCPDKFFRDNLASELLRKCRDMPGTSSSLRAAAAREVFYAAEKQCRVTNDRFDLHLQNGPFETLEDGRVHEALVRVKNRIAELLGSLPKGLHGRHGPGATFRDKSGRSTVADKMSSRPTVTAGARCFLEFWKQTMWSRVLMQYQPNQSDPETVRGNRFTTVPKDAKKDRGICIEPSINIFYQLGVADFLRERLRRVGVDIEECQPLHRRIAQEASVSDDLCTIDLSSASDTVAKKLVKFLLPTEWYEVLESLRSPFTEIEGRQQYLEKFSSMGNGFTFELETIIFLSLACEAVSLSGGDPVIGVNVLCFGDDIIAPSNASRLLLAMLRYCGFSPNDRKTFVKGYFRESCGGDFFNGVPVRAHYLEEFPREAAQWISLANGLRRVVCQNTGLLTYLGPVQRAWFRVLDAIPGNIRRCRGPVQLGDIVIHDDPRTWTRKSFTRDGPYVRRVLAYVPVGQPIPLERWDWWTVLACALYGIRSEGIVPRKNGTSVVSGYRTKWVICSDTDHHFSAHGLTSRFRIPGLNLH